MRVVLVNAVFFVVSQLLHALPIVITIHAPVLVQQPALTLLHHRTAADLV